MMDDMKPQYQNDNLRWWPRMNKPQNQHNILPCVVMSHSHPQHYQTHSWEFIAKAVTC